RPIEELAELSVRSVNSLKKEDIITLGDLVQRTEEQMLNIENFGIKSLEEIRQFLNEHNLHFGMKLEEGEDGELFLIDERTTRTEPVAEASAESAREE
ncbi:MAG: DNA-directed RNA polymerase subunit alpha C-terminal domain-containing protein, partial [Gemmatimonadota bacterium]